MELDFLNFLLNPSTCGNLSTYIGAQTASTDNFFSLLGHGSLPKLVFDMVTEHFCLPMHSCKKTDIRKKDAKKIRTYSLILVGILLYCLD